MNLPEIKIEDLLESGVHFGHNVRRWNPKMEEYIYGVRNNIHIFDLRITVECLNVALVKIHEIVSKSGKVLFVGTKKQCNETVKDLANLITDNQVHIDPRPGEAQTSLANIDKIKRVIGWEPTVSIEQLVKDKLKENT